MTARNSQTVRARNLILRLAILTLLIWAGVSSAQAGLSKIFTEYSSATESISASAEALKYNPRDAEAHYAHALRLSDSGQTNEAIAELEQAVQLNPKDYFLWQELGRVRDENSDTPGALDALQVAVKLAPYYAQPHWQLGNVLLRAERAEEAFKEMRVAASSDPELFGSFVDLVCALNEGTPAKIVSTVSATDDRERVQLATSLITHGEVETAKSLLSNVGKIDAELIHTLINAGEISFAYQYWLNGRGEKFVNLFDGSFESSISIETEDFGWNIHKSPTVEILLDNDRPHSGNLSIRLEYSGNLEEDKSLVYQLIPVESNRRYQLIFIARTEQLMSAGLPVVRVRDQQVAVAESSAISKGTTGWTSYSVEFESGERKAVSIGVERATCNVKPCPIVGKLWLDNFVLTPVR